MNIFILDESPVEAAKMYCDKHVPKMIVELLQQLGSSVIRHGAIPQQMPVTRKGTFLKGGYHNHPATRWCGKTRSNYLWACYHATVLCKEYTKRFGKVHFCEVGIERLYSMNKMIPEGELTPFALCMPDEFRPEHEYHCVPKHGSGDKAVQAYRAYYHSKAFAKWEKGTPTPDWWKGVGVTV